MSALANAAGHLTQAASDIPSVWGTLPGWITALVSTGGVSLWFKFYVDKRNADTAAAVARATIGKTDAETNELEATTSAKVLAGLSAEIGRLQERLSRADQQIQELRDAASSRITHEAKLEQENMALRTKVTRMDRRLKGIESVLKIHPITPEMQAELDKLNLEDE